MAIYAFGAYYDGNTDVSLDFINEEIVGVGWNENDSPELHQFIRTLKVGDIVYIKACAFGSAEIKIKAIGIIKDSEVKSAADINNVAQIARNVIWKSTQQITIENPFHSSCDESEKLNHRSNTIYEEFHPFVQNKILEIITT